MAALEFNRITDEISNKIANAGFVCALLVVAIHTPWPHEQYGLGWLAYHGIAKGIASVAVPIFFAISGYLLAGKFSFGGWWRSEVRKRIYSLVMPFFIWSLICFVAVIPISVLADIAASRSLGSSVPFSHGRWIQMFGFDMYRLTGLAPLWFVRNLFLLVICSPLIKYLVEKFRAWFLVFLFVAFVVHLTALQHGCADDKLLMFFTFGFSIEGLLFFSVGIFQRSNLAIVCNHILLWGAAVIGGSILLAKLLMLRLGAICVISLDALAIPFLTLAVWGMVSAKSWPSWIRAAAFPLFLIHCIVLKYIGLLQKLAPASFMMSCLCYVVACSVPIFISVVIRRHCVRASSVLFAGR